MSEESGAETTSKSVLSSASHRIHPWKTYSELIPGHIVLGMPSNGAVDADGEERPLLANSGEESVEVRSQDSLPKVQIATILLSYFVESVIALFAFPFLGNVRWSLPSGTLADSCDRSLSAMYWNTLLSFR